VILYFEASAEIELESHFESISQEAFSTEAVDITREA
jgi:hypothetical protein